MPGRLCGASGAGSFGFRSLLFALAAKRRFGLRALVYAIFAAGFAGFQHAGSAAFFADGSGLLLGAALGSATAHALKALAADLHR